MTLVVCGAVGAVAAVRAAIGPLGDWPLALAGLVGVALTLLGAVAVAHVAASIAAKRASANR